MLVGAFKGFVGSEVRFDHDAANGLAPSTLHTTAYLLPLLLLLSLLLTNICGGLVNSGTETIWIKNGPFAKKDYF